MSKLILATNNAHKVKEITQILKGKFDEIISLKQANIDVDPEENGSTFLANAQIKAREIAKHTSFPVLADDTGLCVDALDGMPSIYSARYAGVHGDDKANRVKLLKELDGIKNRKAHFETVVVLHYPNGEELYATGQVDGEILFEEDGENGFGYDNIFFCNEMNKSFGVASDQEKNSVSHRARAIWNLLEQL